MNHHCTLWYDEFFFNWFLGCFRNIYICKTLKYLKTKYFSLEISIYSLRQYSLEICNLVTQCFSIVFEQLCFSKCNCKIHLLDDIIIKIVFSPSNLLLRIYFKFCLLKNIAVKTFYKTKLFIRALNDFMNKWIYFNWG